MHAACAAAGSNAAEASRKLRANFGTFSGQAVAIGLASASEIGGNSEQWLGVFVLVAVGEEEEKKNVILGFRDFYHGGPYSFIFFQLGKNVFNFLRLNPNIVLGLMNPSFRPNFNWA